MTRKTNKHTPGPWEAWNSSGGVIHKSWRVGERQSTPGVVRPIAVVSNERSSEEELANARLIAAAPEMLKTLTEIANWNPAVSPDEENGMSIIDAISIARDAIAKATGENT